MPGMATYMARTRRWTRIEYEKLIDLGIFRPGEAIELLGGELIVSEPQGAAHYTAILKTARALEAAELGDAVLGAVDALAWHVGIELEGMPGDGEAKMLLLQEVECMLELALADVTPRADHVGDDVDAANRLGLIHGGFLPYCARVYTCGDSPATRRPSWKSPNTALR